MQIKRGTTRTVFVLHQWAIKVPTVRNWRQFLRGLLGNLDEAEFYGRGSDGLCPVEFALPGGWVNVMSLAQPLTDEEWRLVEWKAPDVFSGGLKVCVEHKRSSWGTLNGVLVAVDYAGEVHRA